jgi:rod shape-determining protein MreB
LCATAPRVRRTGEARLQNLEGESQRRPERRFSDRADVANAVLSGVARTFSDDIAIDLGTANTLVHVVGRGIIIDEPSVVALVTRDGIREVMEVGLRARAMQGQKLPEGVEIIRPMRDGVIADFIATEEMLRQFIRRAKRALGFRRPRILICVPSGATPVERRAVYETALSVGARRVYLIEEPVAAALGAALPIDGPSAFMVIDIGGGTSDVAVLSEGKVVAARSLRVAGNAIDEAIMRYVRRRHGLVIGELNAERIKIEAGAALVQANGRNVEVHIKGRDVRDRQPRSAVLSVAEIAEALAAPIGAIAEFIERALEDLPPSVLPEVEKQGLVLTGGGALLHGLDIALAERLAIKVQVPESPMHCVIRGTATALEHLNEREHLLVGP